MNLRFDGFRPGTRGGVLTRNQPFDWFGFAKPTIRIEEAEAVVPAPKIAKGPQL